MGLFSKVERKMEDAVENAGDKLFDSPISPVQIAKKCEKQMKRNKMVGAGKQYAPTLYTILVNEEDDRRLFSFYPTLAGETETYLRTVAANAGLDMDGNPLVRFVSDSQLKHGKFDVFAQVVASPIVEKLRQEENERYGIYPARPAQSKRRANAAAGNAGRSRNGYANTYDEYDEYSGNSEYDAFDEYDDYQDNAAYDQYEAYDANASYADKCPAGDADGFDVVNDYSTTSSYDDYDDYDEYNDYDAAYSNNDYDEFGGNSDCDAFDERNTFAQSAYPAASQPETQVVNRVAAQTAFLQNRTNGKTWRFSKAIITIGREEGNDIVVSDLGASRQHARFVKREDGWYLEDLHSTNGTLVNKRRITRAVLRNGNCITIGETDFEFILQ